MEELLAAEEAEADSPEISMEALRACEDRVYEGAKMMFAPFVEIHDFRLYKAKGFANYVDYCKAQFKIDKSQAYGCLGAGRLVQTLTDQGLADIWLPTNEAQARPFKKVDQKALPHAVKRMVDEAPKNSDGTPHITAKWADTFLKQHNYVYPGKPKKTTQEKLDEQNLKQFLGAIETILLTPWDGSFAIDRFGLARFNKSDIKNAADKLRTFLDEL